MKYVGEKATTKLVSLIKSNIKKKLDKNQGTANSGKILGVDSTGEVAPTDTEIATLVDVPNGIVKGDGSTLSAAVAGTDYMAPPTSGTAGQVLKKTETGTEWADAPVPDWNQNDSIAADYVKNRTHYEESAYTDYVLNANGTAITGFSMPEVGETTTVKINGVKSTETVKKSRSGVLGDYTYIGTIDFDSLRSGGTGWCVIAVPEGTTGFANPYTTISIDTIVIHKIDPKYLPDNTLNITGATVGQIAKITAVDETGKPTAWEPVDIPSGGTDISLGLTGATIGQTIKVKAVDADGKPTAWEIGE